MDEGVSDRPLPHSVRASLCPRNASGWPRTRPTSDLRPGPQSCGSDETPAWCGDVHTAELHEARLCCPRAPQGGPTRIPAGPAWTAPWRIGWFIKVATYRAAAVRATASQGRHVCQPDGNELRGIATADQVKHARPKGIEHGLGRGGIAPNIPGLPCYRHPGTPPARLARVPPTTSTDAWAIGDAGTMPFRWPRILRASATLVRGPVAIQRDRAPCVL